MSACIVVFNYFSVHAHVFLVLQDVVAVTSLISAGHQLESDTQDHQQVLNCFQQQAQQLSSDVDQLMIDMKNMSVTHTQVTHTHRH